MALKVEYVVRETGSNLRRNITLTVASIVTVAVSLALFGVFLLVREGVSNATKRWEGGIEFVIFMNPDADQAQTDAVSQALGENPEVSRVTYFDKDAAYEEFKELFSDSPEIIDTVTPDVLPPSFRVVPVNTDAAVVEELANQFENRPGVREVVLASDLIKAVERLSRVLTIGLLIGAIALLGAAAALIFNTIRMAMFARRREIEVMKLVGATNWFIRVPFMLEGLIQGLFGAGLALAAVFGVNKLFERFLSSEDLPELLDDFAVGSSTVLSTGGWLVLIGCVVGGIGSAVAVTRFLDV